MLERCKFLCNGTRALVLTSMIFQEKSWNLLWFYFYRIRFFFFLAALGLCCCTRSFSSCGERGYSVVVCGLLIAVASLVAEHGL